MYLSATWLPTSLSVRGLPDAVVSTDADLPDLRRSFRFDLVRDRCFLVRGGTNVVDEVDDAPSPDVEGRAVKD
jgi:hypothetical protein